MRRAAIATLLVLAPILATSAATHVQAVPAEDLQFTAKDAGSGMWEVSLAGSRFTSRDDIEGRLLLTTARFAQARGKASILLLPQPGEGTGHHPDRPPPVYGSAYRHWHVQWYYRLDGRRWQKWRPESGASFWADSVDLTALRNFEAHAVVEFDASEEIGGDRFDVATVIGDLSNAFRTEPYAQHE